MVSNRFHLQFNMRVHTHRHTLDNNHKRISMGKSGSKQHTGASEVDGEGEGES